MEKNNEEQKRDFSEFRKYYAGGVQVVDLTSIDYQYEPIKFRFNDIERQQIYGDRAGDSNLM